MPRISVELSDEEYERLHKLKSHYLVHGSEGSFGLATHAGIMRLALMMLFDAEDATDAGEVIGIASGCKQRVRQVLVERGGYKGFRVTRRAQKESSHG